MISFPNPFKTRREYNAAHKLYTATIVAARDPWLFNDCGVPDTPEGRFEVLTLMAFLVLRQLKDIDGAENLAQSYFDIMFEDIEANLREMGVGETTLAKRMKKLAGSFYGRIKTYDEAISSSAPETWRSTIKRYLFSDTQVSENILTVTADYAREIGQNIAAQSTSELLSGRIVFDAKRAAISQAG